MRKVTVAASQMACSGNRDENIKKAEAIVRKAAAEGARIILLQELFENLYFCQTEEREFFGLADTLEENQAVRHFSRLAEELSVVLPISFFEKKNQAHYNTVAVIDADGTILGTYRKMHIPDGPGYEEKFYFNPGDKGFRVWETRYAKIGVGICWDQWFPEAARCMVLKGAELLFYPTAIGSEPNDPEYDSKEHWQRCMQGHAAANIVPVVASNRMGTEHIGNSSITFYGTSFITDCKGKVVAQADRRTEGQIHWEFDLDALTLHRNAWGVFRDRRPDHYGAIMSLDGET